MKIINNNYRKLIKDNNEEININDGDIIEYTGYYYKTVNDIVRTAEIKTYFIGKIDTYRSEKDIITGIYIIPIYIYDNINNEWKKIINYTNPKTKYFLYPHLLMLPEYYYNYQPLYFLDTCKNISLDDFKDITKEFYLDNCNL